MVTTRHKLTAIALIIFGTAQYSWADTSNVLNLNPSDSTARFYPESFESDTHKMLENWYLRNYASIDEDADNQSDVATSDQVIIDRLAAMPTEIEMPYNSIVRSYIDMYTQRRRQLVENVLGLATYYMPVFEQALDRHGLPMELKYLPVIESALNPNAVSKAGATGLWQFMVPTATGLGLEVNTLVDQRRDPYASSEAAAIYLKQLYDMFGDWSLAIAAYNCGPGTINKALRRAGGGKKDFWEIYPILPSETRSYVPAFIAANYVMTYYGKHNISPALARKPIVTDSVHVTKRVHFNQIADVLSIPVDEIRTLNPQYRKDIIPGNIRPSSLVLPSMQVYAFIANEDSIVNHNASRYSRRDVVEPASSLTFTGSDSKGEYIEEQTIKYHTVARNENLTSIAKKYGVTVSSLRQNNKIGKNVRRGQKLKIVSVERRYQEADIQPDSIADLAGETSIAMSDSISAPVVDTPSDSIMSGDNNATVVPEQVVAPTQKTEKKATPTAKPSSHKVVSGDTLSKISRRYGVTIDAIKKANGMTNDNIKIGQKLKIPTK